MFALARRFKNWRCSRFKVRCVSSEFNPGSEIEVARMALARDSGMSVAELRSIDMRGPRAADLLPRRMTAFHLNLEEIARRDPAVARDLRRVCVLCKSRQRCAKDLARNAPPETWEPYCANSGTLAALNVMTPLFVG